MKVAVLILSLLSVAKAFQVQPILSRQTRLASSEASAEPASPPPAKSPPPASTPPPVNSDDAAMKDLIEIAKAANPVVNYFDPLDLVNGQWAKDRTLSEKIGWLRQAEIKHGRVAMAAFVGYCVQANHIVWPGAPAPADLGPEAQWDAMGADWKWYIILGVGALELIDESDSNGHYMKGRDPGRHPAFQRKTKASPEKLASGRVKEINNGRLAMLGIMGFVSSSSVGGSVPLLDRFNIPAYDGQFWAPFQADFSFVNAVASTAADAAASS